MGKRGVTCERCGYWSPFMRSWFPSGIIRDQENAQPEDVREWNSELYQELQLRDCVEEGEFIYYWNHKHSQILRSKPALLMQKDVVIYGKSRTLERHAFLSKMRKRAIEPRRRQTTLTETKKPVVFVPCMSTHGEDNAY